MKKRSERRKHCALPMQAGSVLHRCTKFEADCTVRSKVINGIQKVGNKVTWPRPRPLRGHFMVHTQGGSVFYVCIKFEADSSFRSKVIRGVPKFRNWGMWPRPRPFRGRLIFHTQAGFVLHLCTKFEADSSFRSKVFRGPKFRPAADPLPGAQNGQNLISWRWSLPLPTNPVWWRSMHAISSYRGKSPTNNPPPPHTHIVRTDYNTLRR